MVPGLEAAIDWSEMDHGGRVELVRRAVSAPGEVWIDFGSGDGAFTLALAELTGPTATLYSVDRDARALDRQRMEMARLYPGVRLFALAADFTRPLDLPRADGALAANALHYVKHVEETVRLLAAYLRPGGSLVVVEYEHARANPWVPYPLPFARLREVARAAGLPEPELVGRSPSRYHGGMYAARSVTRRPSRG